MTPGERDSAFMFVLCLILALTGLWMVATGLDGINRKSAAERAVEFASADMSDPEQPGREFFVVCIADFIFVEIGDESIRHYALAQLLDEGGRGIRCAEYDKELH